MNACVTPCPPNVEGAWGPMTVSGLRGLHSRDMRVREAQSEFHEAELMRALSFSRGGHFFLSHKALLPPFSSCGPWSPLGSLSQAMSSPDPRIQQSQATLCSGASPSLAHNPQSRAC